MPLEVFMFSAGTVVIGLGVVVNAAAFMAATGKTNHPNLYRDSLLEAFSHNRRENTQKSYGIK